MPGQQQLVKCGKYVAEVCALQSDLRGLQYRHPCGFFFPPFSSMLPASNSFTSRFLVQTKKPFSLPSFFLLTTFTNSIGHSFSFPQPGESQKTPSLLLLLKKSNSGPLAADGYLCTLLKISNPPAENPRKKPGLLTSRYCHESQVLFLCLVFLVIPA